MIDRSRGSSSVPQNAGLLSVRMTIPGPFRREDALERLRRVFHQLAPQILTDGILLGHLKASIQWEYALCSLSMTREDAIDETCNDAWQRLSLLPQITVTLSLLSILPVALDKAGLEDLLRQQLKA